MGETRPKQSGEFDLDETWQYLLDLHRVRKAQTYSLHFRSPAEGEGSSKYQMQHSGIEPTRYLFLAVPNREGQTPADMNEYGLYVVDEQQRIGKLAIYEQLGPGTTMTSATEWARAQEAEGLTIPSPEEYEAFKLIFTDLSQQHSLIR